MQRLLITGGSGYLGTELVRQAQDLGSWEVFATSRFDLILLDIALPELDGYAVYKLIRERDAGVPVIIVSAHAQPGAIRAAVEQGACDYIAKPILDVDDFRAKVRHNLGRYGSA